MTFPELSEEFRIRRLQHPGRKLRIVLDTDTYNEIDDQFALVYALLSPEQMTVEAVYAAPFHNTRSEGPGDGMEKSYAEILRLLEFLGRPARWIRFSRLDRLPRRRPPAAGERRRPRHDRQGAGQP